ncbi:hypothetical protein JYQ62_19405 [Nostoc sp. UHCC 0702]|nr:hypothetical protein JYQ62_19405 [Nostoc sp. UHCC 0702]
MFHKKIDDWLLLALARIVTCMPATVYLDLLKKLETGVFYFCWRASNRAKSQNLDLADTLMKQAISEYGHAQTLGIITKNKLHISIPDIVARSDSINWGKLKWEKEACQIDGISTNSWCAKIFFNFRTANSYDWQNSLSFMYVLEEFQFQFYKELCLFAPPEIRLHLGGISEDEKSHARQIYELLQSISDRPDAIIRYWQRRKYYAVLLVPIDLLFIGLKYSWKKLSRH